MLRFTELLVTLFVYYYFTVALFGLGSNGGRRNSGSWRSAVFCV